MSHITTEQALQVPQQLKRQESSKEGATNQQPSTDNEQRKILRDDAVTLIMRQSMRSIKNVKVESFKGELGQEKSFIRETLKNKLAEYNLSPNTKLTIQKNNFGQVEVNASLLVTDLQKLSTDLNNNKLFKTAFDKLSKQEPTLNYVDNIVKISKSYGVENALFNSLISEQHEFNKLNDIAHRYEALKHSNPAISDYSDSEVNRSHFNFVLNA